MLFSHGLQETVNLENRITYYKSNYSWPNSSFRARYIDLFPSVSTSPAKAPF